MNKKTMITGVLCCALLGASLSGCGFGSGVDSAETGSDLEGLSSDEYIPAESEAASSEEASEDESYSQDFFAMDTYMTLTAYGENAQAAVEAGMAEINRLDALLSTGDEESEIYQINETGGGVLSDETAYLVRRSLEVYESTGGMYDISIYPVMDLWGFTGEGEDDFAVPEASVLEETLALVDAEKITLTENEDGGTVLSMEEGMQIDLGGIVKGYADDRVAEIFAEYGVESGVINLGGSVRVVGTKTDGSLWRVGVQDPEDTSGYLGGLEVSDVSVVASGGYERYFDDEETGIRYHHIIDPRTGYSAYNGLISVNIVSEDGTLADALSTALFIMGTEEAIDYCEEHCETDGFDVLLETEDGDIYITDDLEDSFIDLNGDTELHLIETH
ncbi:MAG: FAD:protein FMN transferase [Lachnospiraceae bacterium]|nr:FAD:protein FMN transferase [Lachnospiraceae bacterium]